jgi:hypothetical protein
MRSEVRYKKVCGFLCRLFVCLSVLIMGITPASANQVVDNWPLVSQFGGIMQAVTVYDHVVYAGVGSRLAVMNTADPANPAITGMSTFS